MFELYTTRKSSTKTVLEMQKSSLQKKQPPKAQAQI